MIQMYSTMGARLTPEEAAAISGHWLKLVSAGHALYLAPRPNSFRGEDQVEMLNQATELVQLIYELRNSISNAWHYANKRAFPDPDRSVIGGGLRRRPTLSKAAALAALNLTQRDLDEILTGLAQTKGVTND